MDSNATGKTHSSRPVIGVDVGGTNMQFGVVDGACGLMGRAQGKTEADRGLEHVLDNIVRGAEAACMEAGVTLDDIAAVRSGRTRRDGSRTWCRPVGAEPPVVRCAASPVAPGAIPASGRVRERRQRRRLG
jgi:hypothetical protein